MHDRTELPQVDIMARLTDAVNVSGVLDNCFFHAYSAYLLSNQLSLPRDLFTPVSESQDSPAEQLKTVFRSVKDLEIFNTYRQMNHPNAEKNEMLAEKTLVLGVLFREWFAGKLLKDETHKAQLFNNGNNISFLKVIEFFRIAPEIVKSDDRMAPIYEANIDFFNQLEALPQPNEADDFHNYWDQEGYIKYCKHLAEPHVKLTFTEMAPVLKSLDVPYTLYSQQDGSITERNEVDNLKPPFELSIAAGEGHYYLLKTAITQDALNLYMDSLDQYLVDRKAILLLPSEDARLQASERAPSQLVSVILPKGNLSVDPIQLLVKRVKNIKSATLPVALTVTTEETTPELTEKENQVLQATISTQANVEKYQAYKKEVNALILGARNNGIFPDTNHPIPTDKIDSAKALANESDENFSKRLQDAEFRRAGLK